MVQRLFAGGLFAGLSAGALAALLQLVFVVPLIHQGELYETGVLTHFAAPDSGHTHAPGDDSAPHDHTDHTDAAPLSTEAEVAPKSRRSPSTSAARRALSACSLSPTRASPCS